MTEAMQRVRALDKALRSAREDAEGFARERDLVNQERDVRDVLPPTHSTQRAAYGASHFRQEGSPSREGSM